MSGAGNAWGRIAVRTGFASALFATLAPGFILSLPPVIPPKDIEKPKWYEAPAVPPVDPNNVKIYEKLKGIASGFFFTRRVTIYSVIVHTIAFAILYLVFDILITWLWERAF